MTVPQDLTNLDCVEILVNSARITALKQQCNKLKLLIKQTENEIKKLNNELPPGYKLASEGYSLVENLYVADESPF
tara:strand:+ start:4740 stop:4967 length:228 start_codon:yes stop_codon:yes gene_type:complete